MDSAVEVDLFVPRYISQGLFKRLAIMFEVCFHQGDVNHITGDIHFAALLLKKQKTILTVHDCVSVMYARGFKRALLKFFWFTLPIKRVEYVTVVSEKTKDELLALVHFPEERITVIPDCISDRFSYIPKHDFNKEKPRILHVGTTVNKNLIRVCKALNGIDSVLDIVGPLDDAQLQALKENNITYENAVNISEDALIQKYIDADIVVFVSTYEGFGMPILEAQTVGRALLTSNISPMKEVAGNGAFFADPFDVTSIREGFLKIISDDISRETSINNGLKNILKYKPEYIAKEYSKLYQKVYKASK